MGELTPIESELLDALGDLARSRADARACETALQAATATTLVTTAAKP